MFDSFIDVQPFQNPETVQGVKFGAWQEHYRSQNDFLTDLQLQKLPLNHIYIGGFLSCPLILLKLSAQPATVTLARSDFLFGQHLIEAALHLHQSERRHQTLSIETSLGDWESEREKMRFESICAKRGWTLRWECTNEDVTSLFE